MHISSTIRQFLQKPRTLIIVIVVITLVGGLIFYKLYNSRANWKSVTLPFSFVAFDKITLAPASDGRIAYLCHSNSRSGVHEIWRTTDEGAHWSQVSSPTKDGVDNCWIAVNGNDANSVVVTYEGTGPMTDQISVASQDGGKTWNRLPQGFNISTWEEDHRDPNIPKPFTTWRRDGSDVECSTDNGQSWKHAQLPANTIMAEAQDLTDAQGRPILVLGITGEDDGGDYWRLDCHSLTWQKLFVPKNASIYYASTPSPGIVWSLALDGVYGNLYIASYATLS